MLNKLVTGASCFLLVSFGFLLGSVSVSAQTPVPPPAGAIVVGTSGPYCPSPTYSTIQSAIDAASAGATIYVCTGTYDESLTIDKPLTLYGAQYNVEAQSRDGSSETVVDGSGGITYTTGATNGTVNGFTLSGYTGSVAEIDASGVGSNWQFADNIIDVSQGGIYLNTDTVPNPATSMIDNNVFVQATPSAATSGDAGQAVIVGGGTANNLDIASNEFENLSGPGAAISTPGTAACGATLDTTNFSEALGVGYNYMSESGSSFTDPVNGPGYVDEPFLDLECTNDADVHSNTIQVTDAGDANAKTAIDLSGGDWSTTLQSNDLSGDGASAADGIDLNDASYPAGTGANVSYNNISGYAYGIYVDGATSFSIARNGVTSSGADGIAVESSAGGSFTNNAVSGSGTDDCLDATTGTATSSTADTWTGNGGATSSPTGLCATFTLPVITSPSSATATTGGSVTLPVTATGYPTPKLSSEHLPKGLTLTDDGDGSGTITGTLSLTQAGTHTFVLRASNVFRDTSNLITQEVTLQADRAPAITSPSSKKIHAGTPFDFVVKTVGYPVPSLSETGALPTGITFKDDGNGKATLSGTPARPLSGTSWPITVTAMSSAGSASQSFELSTNGLAATFTSAMSTTVVVGQIFSYTVTTSSNYGTPTLSETGALPSGVSFVDNDNGTATVSGTLVTSAEHSYHFTVTATTVAGSVSKTFTVHVDVPPAFKSPSDVTVALGKAFNFAVHATGKPPPDITESGALPSGVSVVQDGKTTELEGTPTTSGVWSITFTASSSAGSVTQDFTLTVH